MFQGHAEHLQIEVCPKIGLVSMNILADGTGACSFRSVPDPSFQPDRLKDLGTGFNKRTDYITIFYIDRRFARKTVRHKIPPVPVLTLSLGPSSSEVMAGQTTGEIFSQIQQV